MTPSSALLLISGAVILSVYAFVFFCRCLRWCEGERWQQPLAGDRFADGRE
jgi:hypothetical protein